MRRPLAAAPFVGSYSAGAAAEVVAGVAAAGASAGLAAGVAAGADAEAVGTLVVPTLRPSCAQGRSGTRS